MCLHAYVLAYYMRTHSLYDIVALMSNASLRRHIKNNCRRGSWLGIDTSAALDIEQLTVADTRWKLLKPLEGFLEIIAYVASIAE